MRVLIVDDHSMFCDALKLLLQSLNTASTVASCVNSEQALVLLQEQPFDLVLLDWNLGASQSQGAELIAQIVESQKQIRVVVMSAESSAQCVRLAIEAGAVGFVPKEASADLLIDAMRITEHGGIYLPSSVLLEPLQLSDMAHESLSSLPLEKAYPEITLRQRMVLSGVIQGLANKVIARNLDITEGTVKQHLNAVYKVLRVNSRTEAVYRLASKGIEVF